VKCPLRLEFRIPQQVATCLGVGVIEHSFDHPGLARNAAQHPTDPGFPRIARQRRQRADVERYPIFMKESYEASLKKESVDDIRGLPKAIGDIGYPDASEVKAECADFRAALDAAGNPFVEPFLTAPSPGMVSAIVKNEHYMSEEAFLGALGSALRTEYKAIADAGFLLQLDCPDLAREKHNTFADRPLADVRSRVNAMSPPERAALLASLASGRRNRRDKPPRALEEAAYTFDLLGNLGIYRDLHRHRVLSQERQPFTTAHGHDTPPEILEAGHGAVFEECMARAHDLHEAVKTDHPAEAPYVVPFAFRVRWYVTLNLREAVHLCELRSMPQGHPDYRLVVQEMWRRIEEVHPGLSAWGGFVNRDTYRLGRLQSEMSTEWKRARSV